MEGALTVCTASTQFRHIVWSTRVPMAMVGKAWLLLVVGRLDGTLGSAVDELEPTVDSLTSTTHTHTHTPSP